MAETANKKFFISTFTVGIDGKGRVSVPADFRKVLTGKGVDEVVAFPHDSLPCLICCDAGYLETLKADDEDSDLFSEEPDSLWVKVFSQAATLPWDGTGRIILPPRFVEVVGAKDSVAFTGKLETFEIWEPQALEGHRQKALVRIAEDGARVRKPRRGGGGS